MMLQRTQRRFGTSFKKVHVTNPIVDIDGDEMTRVIWKWIKDRVSTTFFIMANIYLAH